MPKEIWDGVCRRYSIHVSRRHFVSKKTFFSHQFETKSAKGGKIKFQKGLSKAQAINAAKDKYDLSVKDRGNTHEQGVESALNDLRKSNWYVESDDIMREEAERELKKFFGEKMKAAPAIKKVMAIKPTKIQVEEMAALKSQIRLEAKAAREAKGDLNTKRKTLAAAITGMVRQGKITAVQARSIINKVSRVNLDNPVMVDHQFFPVTHKHLD